MKNSKIKKKHEKNNIKLVKLKSERKFSPKI